MSYKPKIKLPPNLKIPKPGGGFFYFSEKTAAEKTQYKKDNPPKPPVLPPIYFDANGNRIYYRKPLA